MMGELFTLKNYSSAIYLVLDKNSQKTNSKLAITRFLRPFFPYGRCLGLAPPKIKEYEIIKAVQIFTNPPPKHNRWKIQSAPNKSQNKPSCTPSSYRARWR
jgi:hypothetical protein